MWGDAGRDLKGLTVTACESATSSGSDSEEAMDMRRRLGERSFPDPYCTWLGFPYGDCETKDELMSMGSGRCG